ncbi:MAG: fibronectin type III domain-containing protein [Candidatus Eisenbacteria bacterium]
MRRSVNVRIGAVAALAAAVVVSLAVPDARADDEGTRDVTAHVLIGVSPSASFGVLVDGEALPETPVESDALGILEFAVNDAALPPGSHTVYFAPPDTPPDPLVLSAVAVESVTTSSAVISWQTNIPSNSRVRYGLTDGYGNDTGVDPGMVLTHRMSVEGLAPETTYHCMAVSTDGFGRTSDSGDLTFETDLAPLEISDVTVSAVGPTWAVIDWTTTRPATSTVEYGLTGGYGQETTEDIQTVVDHSVTLTGLLDGTPYHFRVHSSDGDGLEASSPDSTFTTMDIEPTGPPIITDVEALVECINSVTVAWSTDRPATSQVRYGTRETLDLSTEADTTLVTEHVVCVGPVAPRHEYAFVVLSACGADTSESVASVFATELPAASFAAGKGVTIARPGVVCVTETTATLAWSTDRPCTTWVEYDVGKDFGSCSFPSPTRGWSYESTLDGLAPGTLYYYRVCAWDELGGEVCSEESEFVTREVLDPDPPNSPAGLSGIVADGGVLLEWLPCAEDDLRGYFVYRLQSERPGGEMNPFDIERAVRLNDLPWSGVSYLDADVGEQRVYLYAVSAVDHAGNESPVSEAVTVRLDEEFGGLRLTIRPNPTFESATLAYVATPGAPVSARVYSASGRLVREITRTADASGQGSLVWDGRDPFNVPVGSGVYLCEVVSGGEVARRKLTVSR